jgi:hypothetical protein
MGDVSSVKKKVQKKEIQDDSLIQSKSQMNYKKLKKGELAKTSTKACHNDWENYWG